MKDNVLREYVRAVLSERQDANSVAKSVLQKIDDGPYHMLPVDELDDLELDVAETLVMKGLVKRLPANRRFPERFVLTAGGSHATGTFDMDTLSQERSRSRRPNRR